MIFLQQHLAREALLVAALDVVGPETQFVCHSEVPELNKAFWHVATQAGGDSPESMALSWKREISGQLSGIPAHQFWWRDPPECSVQMDFTTDRLLYLAFSRMTLWAGEALQ